MVYPCACLLFNTSDSLSIIISFSISTKSQLCKMIRALKKLKVWSRKKKKRKINTLQPPTTSHCCSCSKYTQPSAPPLPSWLDFEQPQETFSRSDPTCEAFSVPPFDPSKVRTQVSSSEIISEITPLYTPVATLPVSISYQQYLAPAPVYGVPIMPVIRQERAAGLFGCVASVGTTLMRCFCPCFRLRSLN
ncbi:homeobox protein [Tasmannia lanceolata]|uniref:homeobox protein n=1 Tax=Tasmannia lanceolata TaxID=3420 RepID=UPI00406290B3